MQHLEVSGAVRPLKWSLGVKCLTYSGYTAKVLFLELNRFMVFLFLFECRRIILQSTECVYLTLSVPSMPACRFSDVWGYSYIHTYVHTYVHTYIHSIDPQDCHKPTGCATCHKHTNINKILQWKIL